MRHCISAAVVVALSLAALPARAQEHQHPAADADLHEQFYATWMMPDQPAKSCCSKRDCYPTEIKYVGGTIFARRREDGQFIRVPPQKVEQHRDNPDGRNHICAPPPGTGHGDVVFCFALGSGT